jgi:hypothetical protein
MGRPSKLTGELTLRLAEEIGTGVPGEVAAEANGLGRSTYYRWLKWGGLGEPGFVEFRDAIKKARSEAEARYVGIVQRAAAKTWQAAAWWLERRAPKRWGRCAPSPPPERPKRHELQDKTEEELLELFKREVVNLEQSIAEKRTTNAAAAVEQHSDTKGES